MEFRRSAKNAVGPKVFKRTVAVLETEEDLSQTDSEEEVSVEAVQLAKNL